MKISEIFESIQGEGNNAGKPAVFLRTAECNLKCVWCDTKYTWDWKTYDYSKEVNEMSIKEVRQSLEQFRIRHLVITGGEPLMQQDDLSELLTFLKPKFYVEVETNGTILPNNSLLIWLIWFRSIFSLILTIKLSLIFLISDIFTDYFLT